MNAKKLSQYGLIVLIVILVVVTAAFVAADNQEFDGNWCNGGEAWGDGRCDAADPALREWYWTCGWYRAAAQHGVIAVTDVPETCRPAVEELIASGGNPPPPVISTPIPTPEPTPEVTPEPTPEVTPEPTPEVTPEPTPEVTPDPEPEPFSFNVEWNFCTYEALEFHGQNLTMPRFTLSNMAGGEYSYDLISFFRVYFDESNDPYGYVLGRDGAPLDQMFTYQIGEVYGGLTNARLEIYGNTMPDWSGDTVLFGEANFSNDVLCECSGGICSEPEAAEPMIIGIELPPPSDVQPTPEEDVKPVEPTPTPDVVTPVEPTPEAEGRGGE